MFEGVVQLPVGLVAELTELAAPRHNALYMSFVPRAGARYEAQCDGQYAVRYVFGGESG